MLSLPFDLQARAGFALELRRLVLRAFLRMVFADEWMPIITMHTRWDLPRNRAVASKEFGRCTFPWLPAFVR